MGVGSCCMAEASVSSSSQAEATGEINPMQRLTRARCPGRSSFAVLVAGWRDAKEAGGWAEPLSTRPAVMLDTEAKGEDQELAVAMDLSKMPQVSCMLRVQRPFVCLQRGLETQRACCAGVFQRDLKACMMWQSWTLFSCITETQALLVF